MNTGNNTFPDDYMANEFVSFMIRGLQNKYPMTQGIYNLRQKYRRLPKDHSGNRSSHTRYLTNRCISKHWDYACEYNCRTWVARMKVLNTYL